jgi:hypothetical protein
MKSIRENINIIYECKPSPQAAFRIAEAFKMLLDDSHSDKAINLINQNDELGFEIESQTLTNNENI